MNASFGIILEDSRNPGSRKENSNGYPECRELKAMDLQLPREPMLIDKPFCPQHQIQTLTFQYLLYVKSSQFRRCSYYLIVCSSVDVNADVSRKRRRRWQNTSINTHNTAFEFQSSHLTVDQVSSESGSSSEVAFRDLGLWGSRTVGSGGGGNRPHHAIINNDRR